MKIVKHHMARFPLLWVPTTEENRIIRQTRDEADELVQFFRWDIVTGVQAYTDAGDGAWIWKTLNIDEEIRDPQEALNAAQGLPSCDPDTGKGGSLFFMMDFHKYFDTNFEDHIQIIRQALNLTAYLKDKGITIIFLSPVTRIPVELTEAVTIIDFDMPDRETHRKTLQILCEDNNRPIPEGKELAGLVDAMIGLTQDGAENATTLALVEGNGELDYKIILDNKASQLKATRLFTYYKPLETLDDIYGNRRLINFMLDTIDDPLSKGVILYGAPGCGKTLSIKVLANATKRAFLWGHVGAIRGSLQGEAEERAEMFFKIPKAFGNPIVILDEFDKSIAGGGASATDGGTGERIYLKILNEIDEQPDGTDQPYWAATVNSLTEILNRSNGAMVRRFDGMFFVDMPNEEERKGISKIWSRKYDVEIPKDYDLDGFSGADIAKLARNMKMLKCDPDEARKYLVPSSKSLGKQLENIRKEARGTCIWANEEDAPVKYKRKVKSEGWKSTT